MTYHHISFRYTQFSQPSLYCCPRQTFNFTLAVGCSCWALSLTARPKDCQCSSQGQGHGVVLRGQDRRSRGQGCKTVASRPSLDHWLWCVSLPGLRWHSSTMRYAGLAGGSPPSTIHLHRDSSPLYSQLSSTSTLVPSRIWSTSGLYWSEDVFFQLDPSPTCWRPFSKPGSVSTPVSEQ